MATVRRATAADGRTIAVVQAETWRVAYADLLPASLLDALDVERRGDAWTRRLAEARGSAHATFVAEADGATIGFASVGPWRDDDGHAGELYALYVHPSGWGTGAGRLLIEQAEGELRAAGFPEARLWVLKGNERAERFYRLAGWTFDGVEKLEDFGGAHAPERRFSKRL